jgi:hypothetical protein
MGWGRLGKGSAATLEPAGAAYQAPDFLFLRMDTMERQKYCIYNQDSECFLSLGASLAADALGYLGQMFRNRRPRVADEGQWVLDPKPIHTLRLLSPHDLVLLDQNHRVVEAVESWPKMRVLRLREDAASMLTLPLHTIYSSQTQPGHQLLICFPEEMQEKLRGIGGDAAVNSGEPGAGKSSPHDVSISAPSFPVHPISGPPEQPRFVAYNPGDPELRMYGVRAVSQTGIFLTTQERWPLGSQATVTLQRMDGAGESLQLPITVEICVAHWAEDGMGVTFVRPGILDPLISEAIGR